jgi:hypothetical protein
LRQRRKPSQIYATQHKNMRMGILYQPQTSGSPQAWRFWTLGVAL